MGDRILPGKEPVFIFEKNLKCVRDKDWLWPTRSAPSATRDAILQQMSRNLT
jgi:hypothetical protein